MSSAQPTRRAAGARRHRSGFRWLPPAAAAVLACAVYVNALHNPFVYDDHDTVVANPSLVDPSNVTFVLVYSPFRPVVNASYALDRLVWGDRPLGFHVTNVALHAAAVVLLYLWIIRVLADAGLERRTEAAAFTGAALFALHPLQSEAVGYVSGRSEVMCAVWFLAALIAARGAIVSGSRRLAFAAAACGLLALASKEVALVFPVVVLAYDWLLRPGTDAARRRRLRVVFLPIFTLMAGAGLLRLTAFGSAAVMGAGSAVLNLLTQTIVIWRYAGLLVWPSGQSIMHSVHRVSSAADPLAVGAAAAIVVACAAAWHLRRSQPVVAFGILWFLIVLAPSSSIIPLREGMAEHRVYLASAGIFMAITGLAGRWVDSLAARGQSVAVSYRVALSAVLAVLFTLTVMRNQVWASPVSLWTEATIRAHGMWEPHYALADSLRESGDCARAVPEYTKVVELVPSSRDAHTNLGICLAQTGQIEAAERSFRRALEIDPSFARGYTNLGALALVAGDPERARDFYREAIAQDPANVLARMQLASLFEHTFKDYDSAASMCGEARRIAPFTPGVVECVERNQRLAASRDRGR
jgi:Tfp pilus assembly protein PilF